MSKQHYIFLSGNINYITFANKTGIKQINLDFIWQQNLKDFILSPTDISFFLVFKVPFSLAGKWAPLFNLPEKTPKRSAWMHTYGARAILSESRAVLQRDLSKNFLLPPNFNYFTDIQS